ncbi:MAG: hypothetical protein SA339_08265 [Methanomassiliicoccus sp.]|nr:hypothetical protein [Methanomassiliicoccus sp.]
MKLIGVRQVKDRYNSRIPAEGLDYIGCQEGDSYEILQDPNSKRLIIQKAIRGIGEVSA